MNANLLASGFLLASALACAAGTWLDDWFVLAGALGSAAAAAWWATEPTRGATPQPGEVTSSCSVEERRSS